jgi:hypothetical protein
LNGWVDLMDVVNDSQKWQDKEYKVFTTWDGSVKDAHKQLIKSVVNRKDNMDGRLVRVILGSPSVKEGISFKHIQHLHLLDPVWNQSAKTQVEGRAIRFCSHVDIPNDHPTLKKSVVVHIYQSMPRKNGLVTETCDQTIYEKIIPNKYKIISAAESVLKKVAIDHYLFRNMYADKRHPSPKRAADKSPVSIEDDVPFRKKGVAARQKQSTCPKPRRPIDGKCPIGQEMRNNAQGWPCCYRAAAAAPKAAAAAEKQKKCPAGRAPVNGTCPEGFYLKTNKHGVACCFKKRVTNKK